MSFSSLIKDELSRIQNEKKCCRDAEIAAILRAGLILREVRGEKLLLFITEHAPLSRLLYSHIKHMIKDAPEIHGEKTARFKKHVVYKIDFHKLLERNEQRLFLESIGIALNITEGKIEYNGYPMAERCCIRSYLRGGFMAAGSITNPDKSYHLELNFHNRTIRKEYMECMEFFGLKPKYITRKGYEIVYIKEGQDIVDYLNVIGAHHALMEMENIRILKEMRNQVNRVVNCETANLEKTVNASIKQVECIQYIDGVMGLENLPEGLKEIARLRLENMEVSLSELGKMLSPPLSKSGVNHRLKKLEKIAEEIMKKNAR